MTDPYQRNPGVPSLCVFVAGVCQAKECQARIRLMTFLCADHWEEVPRNLRSAVYREYRVPADYRNPEPRFMAIAFEAIRVIAVQEQKDQEVIEAVQANRDAWRALCRETGLGCPIDEAEQFAYKRWVPAPPSKV